MNKRMASHVAFIFAVAVILWGGSSKALAAHGPECIAPAKPGGGFDLTCKLLQSGLQETGLSKQPMRITYMPGGIGFIAYTAAITQRSTEGDTVVAFGGGSLLNIAQRKFGKYSESDVRWLAAIGTDYGMLAVRKDSPYQNLQDLIAALKNDPRKVTIGVAGKVGSQDWLKCALLAKQIGVDHEAIRYVTFEGGGEVLSALLSGHVEVISGDVFEVSPHVSAGSVRILAVFSDKRLPGKLSAVPTAREQGIEIVWPTIRGFYMGPKVSDADYGRWKDLISRMLATKEFEKLREERGLFPFAMVGDGLDAYVKKTAAEYRMRAEEFGLLKN